MFRKYVKQWTFDVRLLSATLLFIITPQFRAIRPASFFRHDTNLRLIVPITWLTVLTSAFFGPGWAMGGPPPARTISAIYMLFLIGWFATVLVFTRWPLGEHSNGEVIIKSLRTFAIIILATSLLATGNTPSMVRDLFRGHAARYNHNMNYRYDKIYSEIKEGKLEVRVPLLTDRPRSMFNGWEQSDITNDPEHWRNKCAARFFKLKSIAIEP
jgi:hypothetical protein